MDVAHQGHGHHPDFAALEQAYQQRSASVLAVLAAQGWTDLEPQSIIDCEAPKDPRAVEVAATVVAGLLGPVRVLARVVLSRPATATDLLQLLGSSAMTNRTPLIVTDEVEAQADHLLSPAGLVHKVAAADLGLTRLVT